MILVNWCLYCFQRCETTHNNCVGQRGKNIGSRLMTSLIFGYILAQQTCFAVMLAQKKQTFINVVDRHLLGFSITFLACCCRKPNQAHLIKSYPFPGKYCAYYESSLVFNAAQVGAMRAIQRHTTSSSKPTPFLYSLRSICACIFQLRNNVCDGVIRWTQIVNNFFQVASSFYYGISIYTYKYVH